MADIEIIQPIPRQDPITYIEKDELVEGGPEGAANRQAIAIANNLAFIQERTYSKTDIDDLAASLQEMINAAEKGLLFYEKEAELLSVVLAEENRAAQARDTSKIYLWKIKSAAGVTPVVWGWVDTGKTELDQAFAKIESVKKEIDKTLFPLYGEGDLLQFADVEGNIVARIDTNGLFYVVGLDNPIQLQFEESAEEIKQSLNAAVKNIDNRVGLSGVESDLHVFADSDGEIVAKITESGELHVIGLDKSVQLELIGLNTKFLNMGDSVSQQGYKDDLYIFIDLEGEVVAKIGNDGRFYIVGLENDIATEFLNIREEISRKAESIKDTSLALTRSYKDTFINPVQSLLNSLMYAQTGAKAPPPLHYFQQNYSIGKTWIHSINQFNHANSERLVIASPYHDDGGVCHPHVLEFYNGFRGYRYIVAITPYHLTNEAEENPCIYGSNDLINFDLLEGFEQPLDVRPSPAYSTGHNSDNVLAYDPKTGELICIWRQTLRNPNNDGIRLDALWMRKTKDGYTWTERERIFKSTDHPLAKGAGSPAIIYDVLSGYWYMYITTLSLTTDAMRLFKSKTLKEDSWEYAGTLVLPFKPWHQDIKILGDKVCMLVYCYPPDNTIYFGIADDFINFEWTQNLLLENNAYKATFVPVVNGSNEMALKILYSTDAQPEQNSEKWRMYMHQTNFLNVNMENR